MIQNYTVICNDSIVFVFDEYESMIIVRLTGLLPFTVYECIVSAATNGGLGNPSDSSVARTKEDG